MYTNDEQLKQLLTDNMLFKAGDDEVMLVKQELGDLYLSSGKIIACDPCCFFGTESFCKSVKAGRYPVSVFVVHYENGDKRVAFSMIRFSEEVPSGFELCLVEGQNIGELEDDEFYGYGVDSGTGGFLDEATWKQIKAMDEEYKYEWLDEALEATYVHTYSTANVKLPDSENNIVAFSTGWGDGAYPSFWGMKDGEICCIVTDFQILGD